MSERRTLTILLSIEVEALSGEELDDAGFHEDLAGDDDEEMTNLICDYHPSEIARLIPYALKHPDNEMFAGSGLFVKFNGVEVVKSEWAAP